MYKRWGFKAFSVLLFTIVLVFFANKLINTKTWAASMYWDGGAGTTNWADALNWSTDMTPTADDDVLIDVSTTINLASSTTVNSLVLGNTGGTTTPVLNFSYDAAGTSLPLTIDSGDLAIYSGGQITHSAGTTTIVGTIAINIQNGNLTIATGGKIDVTGKGYASTEGTGAGTDGSSGNGAGGGAYGGNGGTGDAERAGGTGYGSISNPTNMGSGGGYSGLAGYNGGAGGGLITMTIGGTLDVQGSIISNGGTAGAKDGTMNDYAGGGGSGGGINITTGTFTGAGSITSNGSAGGNTGEADGGGGGGGRIAINYTTNTYTGTIAANGGSGPDNALNGGAGTIYLNDGTGNGDLTISNATVRTTLSEGLTPSITGAFDNVTISGYSYVPLSGTLTVSEALSIVGNAFVQIGASSTTTYGSISWTDTTQISDLGGSFPLVNDNASLAIPSGTALYSNAARTYSNVTVSGIWSHNSNSTTQTYILDIDVTNDLTIASGGKIDVTGKGYASTEGTGAGTDGIDDNGAGGGAYGGNGGNGTSGRAGGTGYGSISNPTNIGSGGGNSGVAGCYGGAGGGLIALAIGGTLDVQGSIISNGGTPCVNDTATYDRAGGGGSGGGINITTATLAGTGSITSNGSTGGNTGNTDGGGGGGGRIAINYTSNTFTGTVTANGGLGPDGALNGGAGTIYLNDGTGNGDLIVSSTSARATLVEGLTPSIAGTFDNVTLSGYSCISLNDTLTVSEALSIAGNSFVQIGASSTTTYGSFSWTDTTQISDLGGSFPLINDNASLIIPSGITLYTNVPRTYSSVTVSGTWSHNSNTTAQTYILDIDVTNDLTIASGGKIDVTGKGYASTEGTGAGTDGIDDNGAGGGAYGGNGGNGTSGRAGGTGYGSIFNPTDIGSGGGNSGYTGCNGGTGGGLVKMIIGGILDVQGSIISNGGTACARDAAMYDNTGGGGSGGGINITTGTLTGAGSITANGSAGGNTGDTDGGGGGGGRIAINYTSNTHTGTITTNGGLGPDGALNGGAGTIYLDDGTGNGDLTISNTTARATLTEGLTPSITGTFDNVTISGYSYVPISGTLTISETLSITEYSFVKIESASTTTYGSLSWTDTTYLSDLGGSIPLLNDNVSLTIPSGTTLYSNVARTYDSVTVSGTWSHWNNTTTQTYILDVDITNDLTIASGGKIDVTGKGYASTEGSGAGIDGDSDDGAGGGAYGGNGGNGQTGRAGGTAYGSITNPTDIGSGGGYSGEPGYNGGAGGGLVLMTVGGTLDIQGNIYANGAAPGYYNYSTIHSYTGGGGSGGGINITTNTLTGTGSILANGYSGANGNKADGGGGGGGRIAINYTTNTYMGTITATGGIGPDNATDGEEGTIYPNEVSFSTSISDITTSSANLSTTISQLGISGMSRYGHIVSRTDLQLDPSLPTIYAQYGLGEPTSNTTSIFEDEISLHGTLYSGTTAESSVLHTVAGKVGNALSFDGNNDYIDLPDGFSDFTNGFAASFWIYPTANQSYSRIFDIGQGQTNDNIMAYREGGSSDFVFNILQGSSGSPITATGAITNNQWQHFVVTVNSSSLATIYKNGVALATGTIPLPANVTRTNNYIGRSNWSADAYYAGYIDELIFFSNSIDQIGVDYLYNEGLGQNLKKFMGDFSYNTLKGLGTYTTSLESLPSSADYSVQSYIVDNSGTQTSYEEVRTFTTLTANTSPTVNATNIVINEYEGHLYAGQSYSIDTVYSDVDGSPDLNTLHLKLDNSDGDDIEMHADNSSSDLTDQTPTISSGSSYISNAKYSITPSYGTEDEVKVTWSFDVLWNWTESTNIEYGIKAIDLSNVDSTYSYTNNDYIYENDLTLVGTLSVENSSSDQIASDSWLLPSESITLSGLTVVYENTTNIYPLDKDFNVTVTDTNSNIWIDGISSGEAFAISATTSAISSDAEIFSIDITGIPTGGSDVSNQSFNFKIDADAPDISDISSTTHPDSDKWYSSNIVRFVWEAIDLESGIKNIFRYVSDKESELSATILQNGTPTTLGEWTSGVLTNGIWHFYLLAEDFVGNISFDKIYLKIDSSIPDIVDVTGSNENVWQNSDGGPTITWTDPHSLSDDMFYITTDDSTPNSSNFAYATNQNSYDLQNLGDGIHTIKVIAQNGAGTYSEVQDFIIRYDATPTDPVKNFNSTVDNQNNIQLTWENPNDSSFAKVVIRRGTSANMIDSSIIYEGNKTTLTDSGLNQLTKYFYTAIVYDNANNASIVSTTNIKTKDIKGPDEVGDLEISQVGNSILIKWRNPNIQDFEKVILKRDGTTIYEGEKNTFNDTLVEKGTYSYTITAYDTSGNASKEISTTFNFVPAIKENPTENKSTENKQEEMIEAKRNEVIEIRIPVEQLVTIEQLDNVDKVILKVNDIEYEMTLSEDKEYFTTTAIAPAVKGQHTITAMAVKDGEIISAYDITLDVKSDIKTDTKSFFSTYSTYIYISFGVFLLGSISLYAIKHKKSQRKEKAS